MTQAIIQTNLDELLADCGTIDAVSWQAPKQMTYAQWAEIGERFQRVSGSINWWLGDWINTGQKKWGEKYTQAIEVTGNKLQTLMNYAYVARNVPFSVRTEKLSWTHHWNVADLDEGAQRELLRFAIDHDLSSKELSAAVDDYKANLKQLSEKQPDPIVKYPTLHNGTMLHPSATPTHELSKIINADNTYEQLADDLAGDESGYDWTNEETPEPQPLTYFDGSPINKPHVAQNSGNNEWYTPAEYIEAARLVMDAIDLDPASNPIANDVVKATTYYSANDDGLQYNWYGNVWMNPPYASGLIDRFISKLCCHYQDQHVDQAIVLVNNATETAWFQELANEASAFCFPRRRVRFWSPDKGDASPLQGQAVLYLGQNVDRFASIFGKFGIVMEKIGNV